MATQDFESNILAVAEILQEKGVQYLVVSGTAIAFHGYIRPTTTRDGRILDTDDFDFWYNPTLPNYKRLLEALENFEVDTLAFKEEEFPNVKSSFFRFTFKDFSVDFLPKIAGNLNFRTCYERRILTKVNQIQIAVISLDDLLTTKKATRRGKDVHDIEQLERMFKSKNI